MVQIPSICQNPQYVAEEFLRSEGFTDVQYVKKREHRGDRASLWPPARRTSTGTSLHPLLLRLEAGDPIRHPGRRACWVLRAVRYAPDPNDPRSSGQDGCCAGVRFQSVRLLRQHGGVRGPRPAKGHQLRDTSWTRSRSGFWPKGRSMRTWASRPSPRSSGRRRSATCWSTARWTARGHSTSAVCWPANREFVRKHPVATKQLAVTGLLTFFGSPECGGAVPARLVPHSGRHVPAVPGYWRHQLAVRHARRGCTHAGRGRAGHVRDHGDGARSEGARPRGISRSPLLDRRRHRRRTRVVCREPADRGPEGPGARRHAFASHRRGARDGASRPGRPGRARADGAAAPEHPRERRASRRRHGRLAAVTRSSMPKGTLSGWTSSWPITWRASSA